MLVVMYHHFNINCVMLLHSRIMRKLLFHHYILILSSLFFFFFSSHHIQTFLIFMLRMYGFYITKTHLILNPTFFTSTLTHLSSVFHIDLFLTIKLLRKTMNRFKPIFDLIHKVSDNS